MLEELAAKATAYEASTARGPVAPATTNKTPAPRPDYPLSRVFYRAALHRVGVDALLDHMQPHPAFTPVRPEGDQVQDRSRQPVQPGDLTIDAVLDDRVGRVCLPCL